MKLTFLLIAVALAACAPQGSPGPATSSAPIACASPGTIEKVCRRQVDRCIMPFADAGKQCTDNDQCAGDCLLVGEAKPSGNVGACQKTDNPCGCRSPLIAGTVVNAICVD